MGAKEDFEELAKEWQDLAFKFQNTGNKEKTKEALEHVIFCRKKAADCSGLAYRIIEWINGIK